MTAHAVWNQVLRALREAAGVTQEGWAAQIGLSGRTVRRWEQGHIVPDVTAEETLIALCETKGLLRRYESGCLQGLTVTPGFLRTLLAETRLAVRGASARATPAVLPAPNLPAPLTSFHGREAELLELARLVRTQRLVTLTGPGGAGKTRLAVEVARRLAAEFPDGVFFVNLAPVRDPSTVPFTIAGSVGALQLPGHSISRSLEAALRNRAALLVLDNVEQVVSAGPLLAGLLESCPTIHLLVTGRIPLHLLGEHEFPVLPMRLPDLGQPLSAEEMADVPVVALFVERAQAVQPHFRIGEDNAMTVAEICCRLDGLPLAVELAAAWSKVLSPRALLARLDHRLPLLMHGARNLPERQQTLRATIAWSYDLLQPAERRLFRRLSVFAASWTLDAAEQVCDLEGGGDVLDTLMSLVDQSLVQRAADAGDESRFTMLETIREYSLELLTACGEAETVHGAHARYFLRRAEIADVVSTGFRISRVQQLGEDMDNMRAGMRWALDCGDVELAQRLVGCLTWWFDVNAEREGLRWAKEALSATPARPSCERAMALWAVGLFNIGSDPERAAQALEESAAIFRQLDERRRLAYALALLADIVWQDGPRATDLFAEATRLVREAGDAWGLAFVGMHQSVALRKAGDSAAAQRHLERGIAQAQALGDDVLLSLLLIILVAVLLGQEDLLQARLYLDQALRLLQAQGDKRYTVLTLRYYASLAERERRWERAARLLGALQAAFEVVVSPVQSMDNVVDPHTAKAALAELGEAGFEAAWQDGYHMSRAETVAFALEETLPACHRERRALPIPAAAAGFAEVR
jgi:predicted ATPase/transcriptional regulator with XRE-family HTH domain